MKPDSKNTAVDLKDFFSASEARLDRWQRLSSAAKAQEPVKPLLAELGPLESCWAYPGATLFSELNRLAAAGEQATLARLADRISKALLRGTYRHDSAAWQVDDADQPADAPAVAAGSAGESHRPYFEVLVVRDGITPEQVQRNREELLKLRR